MLETKSLTKVYRPKKGVPVTALSSVSLKFPDTGMVFLLGKSGSGKSTLLNLLGGLDSYDSGEIIIKGVSSKDFKQQHFDSYRNTYVGFIFQEYNILEGFTVGANIALALELQGKKATDEEINRILADVDLSGYGARRPNELSGGQKQRVAIARALVKNPKIIMADEPSGALDSETGKQVFETLKKLSKEKLVIVVSHDRDFADTYGDRIIELGDGKVISDTTVTEETQENNGIIFEGNIAKIPMDYRLTEEDRVAINQYLERLQNGGELEFTGIKASRRFVPTEQDKIVVEDKSPFKLIKSKLSLKHSFKIGASGLKYKKFRLVMTVLLSCISFVLFGLVDTFSAYNHIKTTANSVYDSGITYAAVSKNVLVGEGIDSYWRSGIKMDDADIADLASNIGIDFTGVYSGGYGSEFSLENNMGDKESPSYNDYGLSTELNRFSGIVEADDTDLDNRGYTLLAGKMPDGSKNEIAISEYLFETFKKYGYRKITVDEYNGHEKGKTESIDNYIDIVGKELFVNNDNYTVVGVIDTHFDAERYESLGSDPDNGDAAAIVLDWVLYAEFESAVEYNYTGMMIVGNGFLNRYFQSHAMYVQLNYGHLSLFSDNLHFGAYNAAKLNGINDSDIVWRNGKKTALGDKEIILSADLVIDFTGAAELGEDGKLTLNWDRLNDSLNLEYYEYAEDTTYKDDGYTVVGVYDNVTQPRDVYGLAIVSDAFYNECFAEYDGNYDFALAAMPKSKGDIQKLAEYCYTERDGVRFALNNPASFELDALDEVIKVLAKVFLYIGLGFAVFASFLLANFIATSISYKKQEIGILRAIGSRGNDVFRIFFAEAFIIAMINFVLACIGTGVITSIINSAIRSTGILVTVLDFGIRQIALLFVISVVVAAIASFLPVKKIASKKPIDAIRNR